MAGRSYVLIASRIGARSTPVLFGAVDSAVPCSRRNAASGSVAICPIAWPSRTSAASRFNLATSASE